MADLTTPFADTGEIRLPTATEKSLGFPCGPADRKLMGGLFNRLESEIGEVIDYAGLVGSDADFTQLRQAILVIIEAATGAGEVESYIKLSQAAARLPIFPEIVSVDGLIGLTAPVTGTIRVPAGVGLMHRGIAPYTTVETDLVTTASKIYHVRWNPVDGFTIKDLADLAYNPTALQEGNRAFDSTFDDMLVARVITNAGNIATITPLANKPTLFTEGEGSQGILGDEAGGTLPTDVVNFNTHTLNWSRRPRCSLRALNDFNNNSGTASSIMNHGVWPIDRYAVKTWAQYSITDDTTVVGWEASA